MTKMKNKLEQISTDLWRIEDTCNVYILKCGDKALAVDFGSGAWLKELPSLGIKRLTDVIVTHHHSDQCAGLDGSGRRPFVVHAPSGEREFIDQKLVRERARALREQDIVRFPCSYHPLPDGLRNVIYDINPNTELRINGLCIRIVSTPGHGQGACSLIVEFQGRQLCFCGDAVHSGGTIWEPFNLEWDHWTGKGALAAWEGVIRLAGVGIDTLCPAHGPTVTTGVSATFNRLKRRLMNFYMAKGQIASGEKDHFITTTPICPGVTKILPHLFAGPANGYLLHSESDESLIIDPTPNDVHAFHLLLQGPLRGVKPVAALVSHAHYDHYDGIPELQKRFGLKSWIHPRVAEGLRRHPHALYRLKKPLRIDRLLPETGEWQWNEYLFNVAPWPGQTWWHSVYMAAVDERKVLFGGDSFQPSSRWNGTGGFCAANRSRFHDGYIPSAKLALRWQPDILACGHRCAFRFTKSRFQKIIRWATSAEKSIQALCPAGNPEKDYYFA